MAILALQDIASLSYATLGSKVQQKLSSSPLPATLPHPPIHIHAPAHGRARLGPKLQKGPQLSWERTEKGGRPPAVFP